MGADLLLTLTAIAVVGYVIYRANQAFSLGQLTDQMLEALLNVIISANALYGAMVFLSSLFPSPLTDSPNPAIDGGVAATYFAVTALLSGISWAYLRSPSIRFALRRLLPVEASYDVNSVVHTTAVILSLMLISITLGQFVLGGGISGLAERFQETGVSLTDILSDQILWILAALLGTGLWLRRTASSVAQRLTLRLPTRQDVTWGIGVGAGMVLAAYGFTLAWVLFSSPEQVAAQTAASSQLAASFGSVPRAFLLSILVACGEETFFRGALQPVFGNVLTSMFFVALHTQYTLSPATIPLLLTSLMLGWLRKRYSTSASIIGHFVFNFVQLFLNALAGR